MKKYLTATAAALLLTAGAAQAQTAPSTYVSLLGGWSMDPHLRYGAGSSGMNSGFNAGGRVGVNLDTYLPLSGFSLEADSLYNQAHYASIPGEKLSSVSFMGDLIYHIPTGTRWGIYGGAGLGGVNSMLDGPAHGSQTVFGWQAIGGVEYAITPATSLFTEYRYQNAHDANIGGVTNVGNTTDNVSVGIKFNM
jgi:opacity protein-like surface antigen